MTFGHDSIAENSFVQSDIFKIKGFSETTVGQIGSLNSNFIQTSAKKISPSQISFSETGLTETHPIQIGMAEIGTTTIGFTNTITFQFSTPEVGILHPRPIKTSVSEVSAATISPTQLGSYQKSETQVGVTQVSSLQVDTWQSRILQADPTQINSAKISLPSSIPSEQFFSIHNFSSASIDTIKDNSLNLWNTLISTTTPFDINFITQDLPIGQLAEEQILVIGEEI